jgi:hypothetical protein
VTDIDRNCLQNANLQALEAHVARLAKRVMHQHSAANSEISDVVNFPSRAIVHSHPATTMADDMPINPQRAKQLTENLTKITSRIKAANKDNRNVRLSILPSDFVTHATNANMCIR